MTRLLLILALLVVFALVVLAMRRGWVNRGRRQSVVLPEFPEPPDFAVSGAARESELRAPRTGLYVGTTIAGNWQDRVVVGDVGHRAEATGHLSVSGLLLDRQGASSLWIPAEFLRGARVDTRLAGKVVPGAGLLVVTWQLAEHTLDTGFRLDDKAAQSEWAEALCALAAPKDDGDPAGTAGTERET